MGETGKRSRRPKDSDLDSEDKSQKRRPGVANGDLVVYRILCPNNLIGAVIGKSGKVINSIRQESRARVNVIDPFPGAIERVITIYCHVKDKVEKSIDEDEMSMLCPAQEALMKVHSAIVNAMDAAGELKQRLTASILVPTSQSANVIGKNGSTIKKLRSRTGANIKVNPKDLNDITHSCAMSYDNFVQIIGDQESVRKALYALSLILYKFSPKEDIPLDASIPEVGEMPPIIIPADMSIASYISSNDGLIRHTPSATPVIGAAQHIQDLHGYGAGTANHWPIYTPGVPVSGFGGSSSSEELVVRVLCPHDKIGRVIGKGGSSIKSVRQATGARIDVDDLKRNHDECMITVAATESADDMKSVTVEAVLMLQGKINENANDGDHVNMRLLVPKSAVGCLIGKGGSIINEMRKNTKAEIRISKGDKPKCACDDEELVEVLGEVRAVRDAILQIVLRLRDNVLKDIDDDPPNSEPPVYASGMSTLSAFPPMQSGAPLGYDQRIDSSGGLGLLPSSSIYGYGSYQGGDSAYRSLSSYATTAQYASIPYGGVTSGKDMLIPASAIAKVIGKHGSNLSNMRKISGAMIEIGESKSVHGDRIALISGTAEQIRTAENLLQAFILST